MSVTTLARKLARLQEHARVEKIPPHHAVILYNPDLHDEGWKQAEMARVRAEGAGYIKTIFLVPEKRPR